MPSTFFFFNLNEILFFQMLKRLSYPLAWMEGFTGDKDNEKEQSVPSSAESSHLSHSSSVFSKVFSR